MRMPTAPLATRAEGIEARQGPPLDERLQVLAREVPARDAGQRAHDGDADLNGGQELLHVVLELPHLPSTATARGHQGLDAAALGRDHGDLASREEPVAEEEEEDADGQKGWFAHVRGSQCTRTQTTRL